MKNYFALLLICISPITVAKNISIPSGQIPVIVDGAAAKRACFYQDQAYSEGALVQVGEHYLICQAANKFETNGPLKWVPLDSTEKKPQ